jgi:hypothetical protein
MNHYVREYLKKNCSGQLQELFSQSHNPYKEIAESMAAFRHMQAVIDVTDENNVFLCVGDGSLCLTGALFAFLTKGVSISIDPNINYEKVMQWIKKEQVRRFIFSKIEYQKYHHYSTDPYNLILVHAHVNLEELINHFPNWRYLYACPCCNPIDQTFSLKFQRENDISVVLAGRDTEMITPKNDVFIYRNNRRVK